MSNIPLISNSSINSNYEVKIEDLNLEFIPMKIAYLSLVGGLISIDSYKLI